MLAVRSSRPLALCAAAPLQKSLVVHKDSEGKNELKKFYPLKREATRFNQHENKVEYLTTKLDDVANYIRTGSLWPMTFGYERVIYKYECALLIGTQRLKSLARIV